VNDHIVVPNGIASRYPCTSTGEWPGAPAGECLEQITVLGFLVAATRRLRLVASLSGALTDLPWFAEELRPLIEGVGPAGENRAVGKSALPASRARAGSRAGRGRQGHYEVVGARSARLTMRCASSTMASRWDWLRALSA
jgi:hypothetical protein